MASFSDLIRGKKKVQTYTNTDMFLQEIVESDVLEDTKKRLILKYLQTGYGARNYALDYANTGAAQFFQYYNNGIYNFADSIPYVTLGGAGTPISIIQQILDTRYGEHIDVSEYYAMTPTQVQLQTVEPSGGSYFFQGGNLNTIIRGYLSSQYDYDYITNTLYHTDGYTYSYIHRNQDSISKITLPFGFNTYTTYATITYITMARNNSTATINLPTNIVCTVYSRTSNVGETGYAFYWTYVYMPYYHIVYTIPSTGRTKLWMYPPFVSSAYWDTRYSELDLQSTDQISEIGYAKQYNSFESYPIVTLRENGTDINSLKNGTTAQQKRYNETVSMLENFGVPLDTITKAYLDSSIDNVSIQGSTTINTILKDAFFQLGVSPAHEEGVVSQVLFDFFEKVYAELPNTLNSIFYPYTLLIEEGNLNTYYTWVPRAKIRQSHTGVPIGTYSHTCTDLPASARTETMIEKVNATYVSFWLDPGLPNTSAQSAVILTVFLLNGNPPGVYYLINVRNGAGQQLRYQINFAGITYYFDAGQISSLMSGGVVGGDGRNTISRVNNAIITATVAASATEMHRLSIHRQISTTEEEVINVDNLRSYSGVLAGQNVVTNLLLKDGKPNPHFLVPLSVRLIESLSLMQRTDLLSHCMHLCLYVYQNVKIEYREGGILKKLLTIVGVVITVIISIIAPPAGAALGASLTTATSALVSVLANLFTNFLVGMALSVALKIIIRVAGKGVIGQILTAVVMVVAVYVGGGFEGALDSTTSFLKTAAQLAEIPSKMIEMYTQESLEKIAQGFSVLEQQTTSFMEQYATINEQYQNILKSFDTSISTEFLVELQRLGSVNTGTAKGWMLSPTAFYTGALEGQYSYDTLYFNDIETFVDRSMMLSVV